jgi:hypothetical protein
MGAKASFSIHDQQRALIQQHPQKPLFSFLLLDFDFNPTYLQCLEQSHPTP